MIGTKRKRSDSGRLEKDFKKLNELDQGIQAVADERNKSQVHQSALFQPYRAFGYYTSQVPICVYKSAEDTLIATVVGKHAFYVFNTSKLNLVFMSRFIAEEITYL
jgi:aspartyl/asparaginyl beta-hydroxylase (cupin superfamily)